MVLLYFAYGSNMCEGRLRGRVPSARLATVAKLTNHRLLFHKTSADGSGKCDAYHTGDPGDAVWGVVFKVDPAEKANLDGVEGLGKGYLGREVEAETPAGQRLSVQMYYAEEKAIDADLRPYDWYRRFVMEGARQHDLPPEYIRAIGEVDAIDDPDVRRASDAKAIVCRKPHALSGQAKAIRQTRIFVPNSEVFDTMDWAETLFGKVVQPLVQAHPELRWYWFSRYAGPRLMDRGDCKIDEVPAEFEVEVNRELWLRSIRFRFSLPEAERQAFEDDAQTRIDAESCIVTDWRDWDQVEDLGGDRFVGEIHNETRRVERADRIVSLFYDLSQLVLHSLIGPDEQGRFRQERSDHEQNPAGSTFESIHHLYCNLTATPFLTGLYTDGREYVLSRGAPPAGFEKVADVELRF